METVADFTASLYVDELSETLTRTNDHYLIISFNPSEKSGYSGTNTDNIATIRRFEGLNVYYLDEQTEKELMLENMETLNSKNHRDAYEFCAKMVSLANKVRTLYMDGQLKSPITTGNLINYAKMMDQTDLTDSDIIEIASTLFRESERELFKNLYEETAKETTKINP